MKKIILAAVFALAAFTAFAQQSTGKGPDFKNRTSTGIVNWDVTNKSATFAGIYNNTKVELLSGKVDCGIDVTFGLENNPYDVVKFSELKLNDAYIEFRPFDKITFGISDVIYTHGSYLPVLSTNISAGNIGSDIVVVFRPVQGMRIGVGYDLPSWFGHDADGERHPDFNLGADYTYGKLWSIGFSVRDLINNISAGIYGEVLAVENLYVTYGYSYNDFAVTANADTDPANDYDYYGIYGKHLISLGATYKFDNVALGFDFLTNCCNGSDLDFYVAAQADAKATDAVTVGLKFQTALDVNNTVTNVYEVIPSLSYSAKTWNCGAGVDVKFADTTTLTFPIYFEFTL